MSDNLSKSFGALVEELAALIRAEIFPDTAEELVPAADLYALGLDSMSMMRLLLLVEERYQITIPDRHLTRDTFATPASLAAALTDE